MSNIKKQIEFTRFIPFLVKEELDKLEYKRKDDLYTLIDFIYRKQINYKTELQKIYGYVELPVKVIKTLIADEHSITNGLNFLVDNNIIERNPHYFPGAFAKSYKVTSSLLSKKIEITIKDKNINKRIAVIEKDRKKFIEKRLAFSQTNYYKTFKIDSEGAYRFIYNQALTELRLLSINKKIKLTDEELRDIIDCKRNWKTNRGRLLLFGKELHNILHRFTSTHFKILCIKNGYLYFKRNDTNGRLDSNLTNLPTTLRQFLISDEKLYNIDIKNSQPFFLYALLKQDNAISNEELERYGKLVLDGTFYEYLASEFEKEFKQIKTRKQMKSYLFKIFFSKVTSFTKLKTFFGSLFPGIMDYINENNIVSNATIANKLSTVESTSIISIILPALGEQNIKPFTIHDSFVCKESEIQTIIDTFNEKIIGMYGIAPSLHVKTLLDDSNDNETIEDEEDITIDEFWEQMDKMNND